MRNILLFEAFNSPTIRSFLKYLNKEESNRVLSDLKGILKKFRYPIDKISDEFISYDKLSKALRIIPEDDKGFYIKYFYDKDGKFITKSMTKKDIIKTIAGRKYPDENLVNEVTSKFKLPEGFVFNFMSSSNYRVSSEYLDIFKTGDEAYVYCDHPSNFTSVSGITKATIYIRHDTVYAIQDKYRGGTPGGDEYLRYGRYSWCLDSSDHLIIATKNKISNEFKFDDSFNQLNMNLDWENADFAITIRLSDMLNVEFEDVDTTKKSRISNREDALALKSHDEIKSENLDRMYSYLLSKLGVGTYKDGVLIPDKEKSLKNLQKIILWMIRSSNENYQFAYELLYRKDIDVAVITDSISQFLGSNDDSETKKTLRRMMDKYGGYSNYGGYTDDRLFHDIYKIIRDSGLVGDDDNKKSSKILSKFKSIRDDSLSDVEVYKKVYKDIDSLSKRTNAYKFVKIVRDLSDKIANYVRNQSINSIEDLILLEIKLNSISKVLGRFNFKNRDIDLLFMGRIELSELDIKNADLDKLKIHKKYIDSILD